MTYGKRFLVTGAGGFIGSHLVQTLMQRGASVRAMIRYRAQPVAANACLGEDGRLHLRFDEPQRAVTPGQLVALLDLEGTEVLGAATILSAR